jgi:hypothetical protein
MVEIDWDEKRREHEDRVLATIGVHDYQWTGRSTDTCTVTRQPVWCGLGQDNRVHTGRASATDAQTVGSQTIQPVDNAGSVAATTGLNSGVIDRLVADNPDQAPADLRYTRDTPGGLEQARRNFLADHDELYAYIKNREVDKALDSLGDIASGKLFTDDKEWVGHAVANWLWAEAERHRRSWRARQAMP